MKKGLLMFLGVAAFLHGQDVPNASESFAFPQVGFSFSEKDFTEKYQQAKQKVEESNHIGTIDRLMIEYFIQHNGKSALLEQIDKHIFEEKQEYTVVGDHSRRIDVIFKPFCIVCSYARRSPCMKGDGGSILTKEIFSGIYTHEVLEIAVMTPNPLNQYNNPRNIDACTSYQRYTLELHMPIYGVEVTVCFYNKQALIEAIESYN